MKIEYRRRHAVPVEVLRERIEARVVEYAGRYPHHDVRGMHRWTSATSAEASYRGGSGRLSFDDRTIVVELEVPFFARPFKGRIEAFLDAEYLALTSG